MPCWYFDRSELNNTPSFCNGVDAGMEEKYRREGAKLIVDAGCILGLRFDVCATGAVYFHRFYMFHSFTDFHRYVVASSCLFLAAKMNESTVTCDAVISTVETILTPVQFSVFGSNPKDEVLATEKVLVEGLRFDLLVELPYCHLFKFIDFLQGEAETIEQLLKMSWQFINDSLCTTLSLEWEPDLIAVSVLYLSCRLMKFKVTSWVDKPDDYTGKWYTFFVNDVNLDIIENVCRQILDLYSVHISTQKSPSPSCKDKSPPHKTSSPVSQPEQLPRTPHSSSTSSVSSQSRSRSSSRSRSRSRSHSVVRCRSHSRSPRSKSPHSRSSPVHEFVSLEGLLSEEVELLQRNLRHQARTSLLDCSTHACPTGNEDASYVPLTKTRKFSSDTVSEGLPHADQVHSGPALSSCSAPTQRSRDRQAAASDSDLDESALSSEFSRARKRTKELHACPDCDFVGDSVSAMKQHCVVFHSAMWQGDRKPLQDILVGQSTLRLRKQRLDSRKHIHEAPGQKSMCKSTVECVSECEENSVQSPMSSASDASADNVNVSKASKTPEKLFSCPNCDYKGDNVLAMKQHCISSHHATWQGDGKPLRDILAEHSFFSRLHKQRLDSHQHIREAASKKFVLNLTTKCSSQSQEDSPQSSALSCSEWDKKDGGNAMQADSPTVCNSTTSSFRSSDLLTDTVTFSSPCSTSAVSCAEGVDRLSPTCPPLQESSRNMSKSVEATPSSVNNVEDATLMSASASLGIDMGSIKGPLTQDDVLACPNCAYLTSKLSAIRLHCILCHILVWQGNGLPLRSPLESELPLIRDIRQKQRLSSVQHRKDAAHQQSLCSLDTDCLSEANEMSSESYMFLHQTDDKSSKSEEPGYRGKTDPPASTSIQPPSTTTSLTTADTSAGDISAAGDADFLSSIMLPPSPEDPAFLSSIMLPPSTTSKQPILQKSVTTMVSSGSTATSLSTASKTPGITLILTESVSSKVSGDRKVGKDSAGDISAQDAVFLSSIMLPPSTSTAQSVLQQSLTTDSTTTSLSTASKTPKVTTTLTESMSSKVSGDRKVGKDSAGDISARDAAFLSSIMLPPSTGDAAFSSSIRLPSSTEDAAFLSSIMLPPSTSTRQSVLQQSLTTEVSPNVTTATVSVTRKTPGVTVVRTESLSSMMVSDMEIDEDSATGQISPQPIATTSLSTDVASADVNSVPVVMVSQVSVPLHTRPIHPALVASGLSVVTPGPLSVPVCIPPRALLLPPPAVAGQRTSCLVATLPCDRPVAQADQQSVQPSGTVMLPRQPGIMPPSLSEQFTPFPGQLTGQFSRGFSAPPVNVCHNSGSEMHVSPKPVPPPGEFPGGLYTPSDVVCQETRPVMAVNPTPMPLAGGPARGFSAPSGMISYDPRSEVAINTATYQSSQPMINTSLFSDVTSAGINSVPDVTVSQVPVPLHSHQIQSGLAASDHSVCTATPSWLAASIPPRGMFAPPVPVQSTPRLIAAPPAELRVAPSDQHSIQPSGTVMLPRQPGIMPPSLREQFTPFPGQLPGQFSRGFSAPSVNVCHNSGSEVHMNPKPVPLPGEFPGGLQAPSHMVRQEALAVVAVNSTPVPPAGESVGGFPALSGMVYHKPRPVLAVNSATEQLSAQPMRTTSLSTDVTASSVNSFLGVTVSQVPVPLCTYQIQSGLATSDHSVGTTTLSWMAASIPPREIFASQPAVPVQPVPRLIATAPCELPVVQPDQHSLLPSGTVLQPRRPGMMPPLSHEQLPPFHGRLPGQLPRVFSAPSVNVCRNSGCEMPTNPTSVRPPEEFSRWPHAPSCVVFREPCPEMAANQATDQLSQTMTSTSLSAHGIRNVSQVPVPLHAHQIHPGLVASGRSVGTAAPPSVPVCIPPRVLFLPPTAIPVQPTSRLTATPPCELPVAQSDQHSVQPSGTVMLPRQPGIMPPSLREQLTPIRGPFSGQFPRGFSAPRVTVCCTSGPEMPVNSTLLQAQGQFPGGLPLASHVLCRMACPEMAINRTPVRPPGESPRACQAPSGIMSRDPPVITPISVRMSTSTGITRTRTEPSRTRNRRTRIRPHRHSHHHCARKGK